MGGIYRIFNRRDFPLGRSLVSDDLSSDEISATGSHQSFARAKARMPPQQLKNINVPFLKDSENVVREGNIFWGGRIYPDKLTEQMVWGII